ncbi:MAG: glycosyltransferase family 9 protein [Mariprofundus sp.]|nr:glycosyltransferase family 9 protein [Mariprofundus sp.]
MKVLIVRLSAFGDIIHCLPALDDLLNNPRIRELHWLIDERYGFVGEILPRRVTLHRVALKGAHPLRSAWHTIRQLRAIGFDAVLDLQGLMKSSLLARACGSPVYGFDKKYLREKFSVLLMQPVIFHAQEKHVTQQYRRITAACSKRNEASPFPYKAPKIELKETHCLLDPQLLAKLGLENKRYIVLHSAGGWETKQLPIATWIKIATNLPSSAPTAVFTWGNDKERLQAETLAAASDGFALPERLNMSALCTLLTGAYAAVGADTGLIHLAAALDTPTITFWGPSASWRSAPIGDKQWHIESNPECGPCFHRTCKHFNCMDQIQPDAIVKVLHEL